MKKLIAIFISILLLFPAGAFGDMTSTNYTIYSDAIGVSGGDFSSSTTYTLTDTFGETPVAYSSSTNYIVNAGYQATTRGSLTLVISTSSLALGILSTTAVNSATTTVSITTDGGYNLSISSVSGIMPAAVVDGSVTAGSEEYGLSATGSDAAFSGDAAVINGLVLASTSTAVTNDATVLVFKAAATTSSIASTYSQTIGLTAVSGL